MTGRELLLLTRASPHYTRRGLLISRGSRPRPPPGTHHPYTLLADHNPTVAPQEFELSELTVFSASHCHYYCERVISGETVGVNRQARTENGRTLPT